MDKKKLSKQFEEFYTFGVKFLSKYLNSFNSTNYRSKEIEILFGSWLIYFIRYYQLENEKITIKKKKIRKINLPFYKSFSDFNLLISKAVLQNTIYQIIKKNSKSKILPIQSSKNIKYKNKQFKHFIYQLFRKDSDAVIYSIFQNRFRMFKIFFELFQMPIEPLNHFQNNTNSYNLKKREKILEVCLNSFLSLKNNSDLLKFLKVMIYFIPTNYLECFKSNLKEIENSDWPKKPKFIMTAVSHIVSDEFKFWVFNKKNNQNTPFYVLQHGGDYELQAYNNKHIFEYRVADKFLSWGKAIRKRYREKQIIFGLNRFKYLEKIKFDKNGHYAMALPHLFKIKHSVFAEDSSKNFSLVFEILKKFSLSLKKIIKPSLYGNLNDKRFFNKLLFKKINKFKKINFDFFYNHSNFQKSLNHSCLSISIYNSTSFFLTLAANHPFVILNYKNSFKFNQKYKVTFDELTKSGIAFNDINLLLKKLKFFEKNPMEIEKWWNSKRVKVSIKKLKKLFLIEKKTKFKELSNVK